MTTNGKNKDNCEWKDLTEKDIKKHLGKYLFVAVPKHITDKDIGTKWFDEIKQFKEKSQPFGGITVNFSGQKATLQDVFGNKPLKITPLLTGLSSKKSEPKVEAKPEKKNGKNIIKVNTVEEMEKEVAKLTSKKGKK
jgi:hypothetical protein